MKLVDSLPWQANLSDEPPLRLNPAQLEIPDDLDLTFVGVHHDLRGGTPDYVSDLLTMTDVIFLEQVGWTTELRRRLQGVADGKYVEMKKTREELERQKKINPGNAGWDEAVYEQLYESKVRVVMPDYPKGHRGSIKPKASRWTSANETELWATLRDRDEFNMINICKSILELRRAVPAIAEKRPLRGLMLAGMGHMAIADGIAFAAQLQDASSVNVTKLFEPGTLIREGGGEDVQRLDDAHNFVARYQTWLRSPDIA
ncbi:MAG: hypothetical protein ACHQT9_02995 [Candidatus Saccharimonadales bacterium]